MITSLHVPLAIVVASGIFDHARQCTTEEQGMKFLRMAADVVDHTVPHPAVLQAYHYKAPETTDARFLAQHLAHIDPLPFSAWPPRKVRSREWGHFTRILQGMDQAMGAPAISPKERARNHAALETFVRKHLSVLDPVDQERLLAHFVSMPLPVTTACSQ